MVQQYTSLVQGLKRGVDTREEARMLTAEEVGGYFERADLILKYNGNSVAFLWKRTYLRGTGTVRSNRHTSR